MALNKDVSLLDRISIWIMRAGIIGLFCAMMIFIIWAFKMLIL